MIPRSMACFAVVWLLCAGIAPLTHASDTLEQAIQLFRTKQYQESQTLLEQVLETQPDNAMAHYYLGRIYLYAKDCHQAIAHCKTSVDIDARVAAYHFCLGRSYGEKARQAPFWMQALLAPKIRQAFEETVTLDPNHREARIGLTHFYMRAPAIMGGSLAKAQEQAEKLIQLNDPRGEQLLQEILERQRQDPSTN